MKTLTLEFIDHLVKPKGFSYFLGLSKENATGKTKKQTAIIRNTGEKIS